MGRCLGGGLLAALACVAAPGCGHQEADPAAGIVVAYVDGEPVRITPTSTSDEQDRRARLDRAIARTLAAREARRRGIRLQGGALAPIAEEEALRDRLLLDEREQAAVSDKALREHYARTRVHYTERRVRLRRWRFESEASAQRGAADPLGETELLDPVGLQRLPRPLVPRVAQLLAGERVVAPSEDGYAVYEVAEVVPAAVRPFSEVRDNVEESWRALRGHASFRALIERLRRKARVEIREGALSDAALWNPELDLAGAGSGAG